METHHNRKWRWWLAGGIFVTALVALMTNSLVVVNAAARESVVTEAILAEVAPPPDVNSKYIPMQEEVEAPVKDGKKRFIVVVEKGDASLADVMDVVRKSPALKIADMSALHQLNMFIMDLLVSELEVQSSDDIVQKIVALHPQISSAEPDRVFQIDPMEEERGARFDLVKD